MTGTWALNLFDRLHIGHQVMIDRLSEMPDPVACVTSGVLLGEGLEFQALIQPIDLRERNLKNYLRKFNLDDLISVRTLTHSDDLLTIEGNTTFVMYEGPCCTEIESGALDLRKRELGVSDKIEFLKPVRAHDGEKIASARIRQGEIDREGRRLRGTNEPARILQLERCSQQRMDLLKHELSREFKRSYQSA
jgi:phosphopantetheine adenylyltransferase